MIIRPSRHRAAEGSSTGGMPRAFRLMLSLSLAVLLVGSILVVRLLKDDAPAAASEPLPVVKEIPAFTLTGRDGRTVSAVDLRGTVWLADFFFTSCTGPCPELTLRMRSLQQSIRQYDGAVKIVSFSVDPTYDTPARLTPYAERYGADPKLWWFLTSDDETEMHTLVTEGFLQALTAGQRGNPIIHTTSVLVIDRAGRLRSWHDGLDPDSKPLILRDVEQLLAEPSS